MNVNINNIELVRHGSSSAGTPKYTAEVPYNNGRLFITFYDDANKESKKPVDKNAISKKDAQRLLKLLESMK